MLTVPRYATVGETEKDRSYVHTSSTKLLPVRMALKLIGMSFGRTGTASVKAAPEQLGFDPCHHMQEVFGHPEHIWLWQATVDGNLVDWDSLLRGYQATVNWPDCASYEEGS